MDDDQLEVRYNKMKKADKIGAFYEALVDEDRALRVRRRIEDEYLSEAEVKKAEKPEGTAYDAMSPKQRREYDIANKK